MESLSIIRIIYDCELYFRNEDDISINKNFVILKRNKMSWEIDTKVISQKIGKIFFLEKAYFYYQINHLSMQWNEKNWLLFFSNFEDTP